MSSPHHDARLLGVQAEMARLADLVEHVADEAWRKLKPKDRRIGAELLPAAAAVIQGDFEPDQLGDAAVAAGGPLLALVREHGVDSDGKGYRRLGRLLERLSALPDGLAGYRVRPAGEGRRGRRWRIVRVSRG